MLFTRVCFLTATNQALHCELTAGDFCNKPSDWRKCTSAACSSVPMLVSAGTDWSIGKIWSRLLPPPLWNLVYCQDNLRPPTSGHSSLIHVHLDTGSFTHSWVQPPSKTGFDIKHWRAPTPSVSSVCCVVRDSLDQVGGLRVKRLCKSLLLLLFLSGNIPT